MEPIGGYNGSGIYFTFCFLSNKKKDILYFTFSFILFSSFQRSDFIRHVVQIEEKYYKLRAGNILEENSAFIWQMIFRRKLY